MELSQRFKVVQDHDARFCAPETARGMLTDVVMNAPHVHPSLQTHLTYSAGENELVQRFLRRGNFSMQLPELLDPGLKDVDSR